MFGPDTMEKRALVFGTFDILHPGHFSFLKQARQIGGVLIASVARDEFVSRIKGKKPVYTQKERIERLLSTGLVDEAYLSDYQTGTYDIVRRVDPDVICIGHDQERLLTSLDEWLKQSGLDIPLQVLDAYKPEIYKSSKLKTPTVPFSQS